MHQTSTELRCRHGRSLVRSINKQEACEANSTQHELEKGRQTSTFDKGVCGEQGLSVATRGTALTAARQHANIHDVWALCACHQ